MIKKLIGGIKHFDLMVLATFTTMLAYSATYPYIHKQVMMVVSEKFVALSTIINCLGVILTDRIWQHFGKKLYKSYVLFCILECATTTATALYCLLTKDLASYFIIDSVVFAIMSRNVICGSRRLRAIRYKKKEDRIKYENNDSTAGSIATLIGSGLSIVIGLPFEIMLIIATIGNCVDNAFYIKIFNETPNIPDDEDIEESDEE
jgi:hypothetical protein